MPAAYESLKAVIDSMDAIIYVADMETYDLLLVNDYTRRHFGDIQGGKCWANLQQGQTGPCDFCSNNKLIGADGLPRDTYVWEFHNTLNGRWYECRDKAIIWRDGRLVRLEIATDITERKDAEERLRQQIERYDLVTAGVRDGIWDWDVPKKKVFFSARWKTMRGFSEEEVSDHEEEWSSGIHPEDAPRVFASVQAHFAGETPWFTEEYRVRRKDNTWMWVLDRGLALRDAAGRVVRMAGSETDITLRKQMEEEREKLIAELREALAKVKTLSGMLPICSHCKKIRDDKGYWNQVEIYIRDRSEAEFSHGICPDCLKKYYPEYYDKSEGQARE